MCVCVFVCVCVYACCWWRWVDGGDVDGVGVACVAVMEEEELLLICRVLSTNP